MEYPMTEYAIPLTNNDPVAADSPEIGLFAPEPENKLPRVDPTRGVFITSRGEEIELADKPISPLIVERLQSEGKPKIPMIEVTLLGKHKQLEPHPGHEGYQARLKEWESESNMNVLRYLFTVGVKGTPPASFVEEQAAFFPTATASEMKYLWVASRLPDDDLGEFTEAVMGRTMATPKGLEESADSFRR
jgi:hypothetical protein